MTLGLTPRDARARSFWLALVLLVVDLMLPFGFALVEIAGAVSAYISAYTLHFLFLRAPQRRWMLVGLVVLGVYVSVNLFAAVSTIVLLVPAAIALARTPPGVGNDPRRASRVETSRHSEKQRPDSCP